MFRPISLSKKKKKKKKKKKNLQDELRSQK